MNKYVSGTFVRSIATFYDATGTQADPTSVIFSFRPGAGSVTQDLAPTKIGVGVYCSDMDTSGWPGPDNLLYTCQWEGTGAVAVVSEPDYFEVEAAAL